MKKIGIAGVVLVALAVLLGMKDHPGFFQAYLQAYLFWLSVPMGALGLRLIHHLTGGGWGKALGPYLDSAIRTMPLAAILFIPIVIGIKSIYPWAVPMAHGHELTGFKAQYLTIDGFIIRAAVCFVIWLVLSFILSSWSKTVRNSEEAPAALQGISGVGLVAYVVSMTVAAVDWGMSLDPHWFSTVYPALIMAGQGLSAFSFGVLVLAYFQNSTDIHEQNVTRTHDIGNLMLAFTMLWTYMMLSQFLIIWSADLPEENIWYLVRLKGGWKEFGILVVALRFVVPFFLLLNRPLKRDAKTLAKIAILIFIMRYVELSWLIKPTFHAAVSFNIFDLLLWIGLGGIWIPFFFAQRAKMERHS